MMKIYLQISLVFLAALFSACQSTSSDSAVAATTAVTTEKNVQTKAQKPAPRSMGHGASEADRKTYIAEHDTNGDEQVSPAEIEIFRKARFDEADGNRDGVVSEDEYVDEYATRLERQIFNARNAHVEQTHTRFTSLDKNNDSAISRDEYQTSGERAFAQWDKQNTGRVAVDTSVKSRAETRSQRSVLSMPTSHSSQGFLELYDEDADGVVTRAEFDKQRQQAFFATDTNGDRLLSADEYLLEFENRLDRQAERVREQQIKQAYVRFGVIDADKSGSMEWNEFLAIGMRGFERWDVNGDGLVSVADPLPTPRVVRTEKTAAKKSSSASY
jgi:Ca2+-binding EF-hand superfamily protein